MILSIKRKLEQSKTSAIIMFAVFCQEMNRSLFDCFQVFCQEMNRSLFDCFQVLDREGQMDNPCTQWLTELSWDNITELDK